ncbi:MAG: imidazole glycerol phosphate synthase subunit HisH [Leptospiraceae bacterium]|nr:imidazole glycerol phosphate synthase subunit HisH [Leptospiraceae bacterium]MDW7976421.1 imidazole glycerol phosphate synthase subunit HisH [Leptospiraceae bacterium]
MIVVLNYKMGNIHSIIKALRKFYPEIEFSSDKKIIQQAKGLVMPGDGHFHTAMNNLKENQLDKVVLDFIETGKPVLGICIGFQILFSDSTEVIKESGLEIVKGLDIIKGNVRKFSFSNSVRIPHMGWNKLQPNTNILPKPPSYFESYMYFIHSFRPENVDEKFILTWTNYENDVFPSTVRKENIWGSQYHPEKSDKMGLEFLKDWVDLVKKQ